MSENKNQPLLEVKNLKQYFRISRSYTVKAVNGVSFVIYPGETLKVPTGIALEIPEGYFGAVYATGTIPGRGYSNR